MIPTYTTPIGLPKICLAFDWPTQMKIPRTVPAKHTYTTPIGLPKICLAFDWPTQMKIPRTAPAKHTDASCQCQCFEG